MSHHRPRDRSAGTSQAVTPCLVFGKYHVEACNISNSKVSRIETYALDPWSDDLNKGESDRHKLESTRMQEQSSFPEQVQTKEPILFFFFFFF